MIKKIVIAIILAIITAGAALIIIYEYWAREQSIDFSLLMPAYFTYCEKSIQINDQEYSELRKWFGTNTEGWVNSPVTFAQFNELRSENMNVTLLSDGVVVNYTRNGKEWNQVVKSKKEGELAFTCNLANKSLKDGTPQSGAP